MNLHFDIRDIFRCVRLGWSGKKIWVGLLGLFVAWTGYSVLLLIAHIRAGSGSLWQRYGLFPGATLGEFDLFGTGLHILGMVFALSVVFITTSMMCKITFQQLRGDEFYSVGDAWRFARARWKTVLFGPVAVFALFALFVVGGIAVGWVVSWIPSAGEIVFALCFIPLFFAALLAVFIGLVFVVAVIMSPAIVGTEGYDILDVVIQSFSLTWSQPWRLVLYAVWMVFSMWVGLMVMGALTMAAIGLIAMACGLFMDVKLANLFDRASHYLLFVPEKWDDLLASLPAPGIPSGAEVWGGGILGVMLIVITGIVIAYVQATYASGLSLMYLVLRHRKDNENLLARDDDLEVVSEEADDNTDSETA